MVSPMSRVNELVSSDIGNYLTNKKTWESVMYNVLEYELNGDGSNDTAALQALVNTAIAAGRKAIFFPHTPSGGQYFVTALTNADQVEFFGDNASFIGGYTRIIRQLGDWDTARLNGTVQISMFSSFQEAVTYCLANNKILDLCTTTITGTVAMNGMELCSIRNGTIVLNDYIRFYISSDVLIEDMTFIDNYVYQKTQDVPINFDHHSIGWVIESKDDISNNVIIRRVQSYSINSLVDDGNYRTRGFINLKGNNIVIDSCNLEDSRNPIRMGINTTNAPQWSGFTITNCNFKNVEQAIDLLNVSQVTVQNCTLVNTSTQQANYSQIKGADFVSSISSDDIYVCNVRVERPVERTVYIVNAKRFHLDGFNISVGGLGGGGGLKIVGWGDSSFMSRDCIIENGYCGTSNNSYFDFYGVRGITVRNISTGENGSSIFSTFLNRCQEIMFDNVVASFTGALVYATAAAGDGETPSELGLDLSNLVIKNCKFIGSSNSVSYFWQAKDETGGTYTYLTLSGWVIDNCIFDCTNVVGTRYLFASTFITAPTNIKVKDIVLVGGTLPLYDFTFNTAVNYYVNIELYGKMQTNQNMSGIDFPNVIASLPKGTRYSLDLILSGTNYGYLSRDNNENLVFHRTFNVAGVEYVLKRIQSGVSLNFVVLIEIEASTFAAKFLLSSNGTALTATSYYGTITTAATTITFSNGDTLELDTFSILSSLRYRSLAGAKVGFKMTLISTTYV